jgi:hypothetical protein
MDGKLELLGHADQRLITALLSPLLKSLRPSSTPDLLSLAEVAARTGFARKTLYEWKRTGKLRREHGLRTVNGTPRIDWQLFKASLDKGELSWCSSNRITVGWRSPSSSTTSVASNSSGLRDNHDNQRKAEKLGREIEAEIRAGAFDYARRFPNSKHLARLGLRVAQEPTLADFARTWLEEKATLTPASRCDYESLLKVHLYPHPLAAMRLAEIDDGHLNRFIADIAAKKTRTGEPLSARRMNMVITRLRTIFATAYRRRLTEHDPMRHVENRRERKPEVNPVRHTRYGTR